MGEQSDIYIFFSWIFWVCLKSLKMTDQENVKPRRCSSCISRIKEELSLKNLTLEYDVPLDFVKLQVWHLYINFNKVLNVLADIYLSLSHYVIFLLSKMVTWCMYVCFFSTNERKSNLIFKIPLCPCMHSIDCCRAKSRLAKTTVSEG